MLENIKDGIIYMQRNINISKMQLTITIKDKTDFLTWNIDLRHDTEGADFIVDFSSYSDANSKVTYYS